MTKIPTWTTANGRVLKLKDMEIDHLINTFHFLKRKSRDEYELFKRNLILDDDVNDLSLDAFCGKIYPIYIHMRKEIANRLRKMTKNSIERKFWHMKFSKDTKDIKANIRRDTESNLDLNDEPMGRW